MNLAALKSEIQTDPLGRGYAGKTDEQIANLINSTVRQVDRETVDGGTIAASIVRSEFAGLSAGDKQYVSLLIAASNIPLTSTLKTELGAVFAGGSATRANFVALLKRSGFRWEELNLGESVTSSFVADAKRS